MADMKQVLLKLGNQLKEKHGFEAPTTLAYYSKKQHRRMDALHQFLLWLDETPEAREELENLGYSFIRTVPYYGKR